MASKKSIPKKKTKKSSSTTTSSTPVAQIDTTDLSSRRSGKLDLRKTSSRPGLASDEAGILRKSSKLKAKMRRGFRSEKSINYTAKKIAPARHLASRAVGILWKNKKIFGGILLIYGFVQLILVKGLLSSNFSSLVEKTVGSEQSGWGAITSGLSLFGFLAGSGGRQITPEGSLYQTIFIVLSSLAIIWALRRVYAGTVFRIRDAYYKGMTPLIPFILVLSIVLLETFPFIFGVWLLQVIIANGIAVSFIEQLVWLIICLFIMLPTFYMITSSIIAMYVVTLPDMTPLRALRSARDLVRHRRLQVFWRLLALAIISSVVLAVIMTAVIIILPAIAPFVFYSASIVLVAFVHAYIYGLYRELLDEE